MAALKCMLYRELWFPYLLYCWVPTKLPNNQPQECILKGKIFIFLGGRNFTTLWARRHQAAGGGVREASEGGFPHHKMRLTGPVQLRFLWLPLSQPDLAG